jgi:hypothetical protein
MSTEPTTTNPGGPGGSLIITLSIVLASAAAVGFAIADPNTIDSWWIVGLCAVVFGAATVAYIRRRSIKLDVLPRIPEGIFIAVVWAIAVVVLAIGGRGYHNGDYVSLVACVAFLAASVISIIIAKYDLSEDTKRGLVKSFAEGLEDGLDD